MRKAVSNNSQPRGGEASMISFAFRILKDAAGGVPDTDPVANPVLVLPATGTESLTPVQRVFRIHRSGMPPRSWYYNFQEHFH